VLAGQTGGADRHASEIGGDAAEAAKVFVVAQFVAQQWQRAIDPHCIVEQADHRQIVRQQAVVGAGPQRGTGSASWRCGGDEPCHCASPHSATATEIRAAVQEIRCASATARVTDG